MATTFTWKIVQLDRELADGYVYTAHWRCDAVSSELREDGTPYQNGGYGSVGLERPETLIDFDDLTKDQVIGWVKDKLGGAEKVAQIEAALQAQLDEQITPSRGQGVPSSWAD